MITCHIQYIIDPYQISVFERYARGWISLIEKHGGRRIEYLLPSEGANNVAHAYFSFTSLADYERYRTSSSSDPECLALLADAERTRCIRSYIRTFLRPLTP